MHHLVFYVVKKKQNVSVLTIHGISQNMALKMVFSRKVNSAEAYRIKISRLQHLISSLNSKKLSREDCMFNCANTINLTSSHR